MLRRPLQTAVSLIALLCLSGHALAGFDAAARAWIDDMRKAGARHMYAVIDMDDFPAPPVLAVPVDDKSDARRRARQTASMANLRQIAIGVILHATEADGATPPDLGTLVRKQMLDGSRTFISPWAREQPQAAREIEADRETLADWVNANTSYIYVGGGKNMEKVERPAEMVLAYEDPAKHPDGDLAVAFFDGHCERISRDKLAELLKK